MQPCTRQARGPVDGWRCLRCAHNALGGLTKRGAFMARMHIDTEAASRTCRGANIIILEYERFSKPTSTYRYGGNASGSIVVLVQCWYRTGLLPFISRYLETHLCSLGTLLLDWHRAAQ